MVAICDLGVKIPECNIPKNFKLHLLVITEHRNGFLADSASMGKIQPEKGNAGDAVVAYF